MSRKTMAVILVAVPLLLFMSADERTGPSAAMDLAGKAVNFLILFGGLAFVLRKPLSAMLSKRALDIRELLREAEASKTGSLEKLAATEERMAGLEAEVERIAANAEAQTIKLRERIALQAETESLRIRKLAEQEIDEQVRAGIRELRSYAADGATSLARERIRKRLTPDDQVVLIDKSIRRLSELYEKSGSR